MIRLLLVAACVAGVLACNGKKARPTPPGGGSDAGGTAVIVDPAEAAKCDALKDKVAGLYKAELTEPVDGEVDDNTHMVLTDCRADPARFVSCIQDAASVAELERNCVIPLDDEGTVEARQFK